MEIRDARRGDAAVIAAVHAGTWQAAYRGHLPEAFLARLTEDEPMRRRAAFWREQLATAQEGRVVLVAEDDGAIVGFVWVGPSRDDDATPRTAELYAIYVLESHWDRGVGWELHDRALAALAHRGAERVTLWVLATNERARGFYERQGWRSTGETKTETMGEVELEEARYVLDLGRSATEG